MKEDPVQTILLVDDEAIIAMAEARILEQQGYTVITAFSGEQAITTASENPSLDLILMDIDLGPGMDGTQAAEAILKTADIPVLFLSSHTEAEVVDKTEKITSYGYVVKNSGETVLLASIRMAFRLHAANHEIRKREEQMERSKRDLEALLAEHKTTENALKKSENEFRSLFEASPAGVGLLKEHRLQKINAQFCKIMGYTENELLGQTTLIFYDDEEKYQRINRELYGMMEREGLGIIESSLRHKSGRKLDMYIRVCPVDPRNTSAGIVCTLLDITERKRAEEALIRERDFSQATIDSLPGLFYLVDDQGGYIRWNKNFTMATGYTDEEIRRMTPPDFFREQDRGIIEEKMRQVFSSGEVVFEGNVLVRDGHLRPYLITGKLFHFEDKPCLLGTAIDISERTRAEKALKRSEERFRDLVGYLPETVFETDRDGRITFVNQTGLERFGYTREDLDRGLMMPDIIAPQDRTRVIENIEKIRMGNELGLNEYTAVKKDGTTFPVLTHSAAIIRDGMTEGIRGFLMDLTERKRSEKAIFETKNKYRSIINSVPIGMHFYRLEENGRLVFDGANPAADSILGVDNSMFIGKTIEEAFPPLTATEVPRRYREVAANGAPWHTEQIDYDGNSIQGAFDVHAFQIGSRRMAAAFTDITERKRAEDELKKNQQLLNTVYENVGAYIFLKDTGYRYIYANPRTCELFCRDLPEIIGKTDEAFFSADSIGEIMKSDTRVIEQGETVSREETNLASVGGTDRRTYWTVKLPLRDANGAIYGLCGISTDITNLKRAEEALLESEKRWQFALEGAGDGVWDWNPQTDKVFFSRQWKALLGYEEDEIGADLSEWESRVHPDDLERANHDINEHFEGNTPVYTSEHRMKCKNGEYRWILARGKVMSRTPDGMPLRVIGTHTDIMEIKRTQEALDKAIKEKEALLSELQHRMKNSLAMITGILTLEINRPENAGAAEILTGIRGRIDSLANLYALLFKSEKTTVVSLDDYIRAIVHSLSGTYSSGADGISIDQRCERMEADAKSAAAWGLIANELLTNALKYAYPPGTSGAIGIRLEKTDGNIELAVTDQGKGPGPDFNIDTSPGFGLLLVGMLAKQLGGSLVFERGQDNAFIVRAPGAEDAQ